MTQQDRVPYRSRLLPTVVPDRSSTRLRPIVLVSPPR